MPKQAPTRVGGRVTALSLQNAAANLGLSPDASKSAVIRGALALFHGLNPKDYMNPPRRAVGRGVTHANSGNGIVDIAVEAPPELTQMPEGIDRVRAIRIGLIMANGWSREAAEKAADEMAKGIYAKDVK